MHHRLIDAHTIKELRAKYAELSKRLVSVVGLNTALRNENAQLRREIARLTKDGEGAACPTRKPRSRSAKSPT
jgi:regulator of replication initiation timing